jgi:hypothetical protein
MIVRRSIPTSTAAQACNKTHPTMPSALRRLASTAIAVVRSAVAAFVTLTVLREIGGRVLRRRRAGVARARRASDILPSLYDRHPGATAASRRRLGLRTVAVDDIVGTARHPSQNTADFLPLRMLRGKNWQARWDRIVRAMNALRVLPPVELFKVGDEYYVIDGHNRVAAALRMDQVAVDADVVELRIAGVDADAAPPTRTASALIGADELWQAGSGRHSSTVEQRTVADQLSRQDLLRVAGEARLPDDTGDNGASAAAEPAGSAGEAIAGERDEPGPERKGEPR